MLDSDPQLALHETATLLLPVTVALKGLAWDSVSVMEAGETVILTVSAHIRNPGASKLRRQKTERLSRRAYRGRGLGNSSSVKITHLPRNSCSFRVGLAQYNQLRGILETKFFLILNAIRRLFPFNLSRRVRR